MKFKGKHTVASQMKTKYNGFKVTADSELLLFMISAMPGKNRNNIKTLLKDKFVEVDGKVQTQFNLPVRVGQTVSIRPRKGSVQQTNYKGLEIIHEDKDIIVINKEAGLLSMANDKEKNKTAYALLSAHVKKAHIDNKVYIVHRLDRETSGLILFAKNEEIKNKLQENWNDTIQERTYIALVEGKMEQPTGTITSYLVESEASMIVHSSQNPKKGKKAITHYKTMNFKKGFSMLKVNLETGRKNQIRVHMQDLKHPIVGDKKYGSTCSPIERLGLHAQVIAFTHPVTGRLVRYESPIPKKFLGLFN
jgi:23S rRNA pseudouridine1911/1915/1917 synthase